MKRKCRRELESALSYIGYRLEVYRSISSTSDRARAAPARSVIVADKQTAGRGRKGKSFFSPKGGLYMSIALDPGLSPDLLTIAGAVAVSEAVKEAAGRKTQIKWVNDVLLDGKKICGILAESVVGASGSVEKLVLGIGINLYAKAFPPGLENAGALFALKPPVQVRGLLISKITAFLEELLAGGDILDKYRELSCVIGRNVVLSGSGERVLVTGIDDTGGLLVENKSGKRVIKCGEISIVLDDD